MNHVPLLPPKKEESFTKLERLYAVLALLLGFLFARTLPIFGRSHMAFLLILLIFGVSIVFLVRMRAERVTRLGSYLLLGAGLLLSLAQLLLSNGTLQLLLFFYVAFFYLYWVSYCFGATEADGVHLLRELARALFARPFGNFFALPRALKSTESERRRQLGKTLLWIVAGLLVAIIPSFLVARMLSFDERFNGLLGDLFASLNLGRAGYDLFCLALGIPVGMYLFAAWRGGLGRWMPEESGLGGEDRPFVPASMACAALTPILLLYAIFFVSQGEYNWMAFGERIPDDLIYSEYARRGFFELCAVSGFNALLLSCAHGVVRRDALGHVPLVLRIWSAVMSVFTLLLIATALSKMILYISMYGLSQKRVYTTWLMLLLAVAFVLVLVKQMTCRFRLTRALAMALTSFLILLSLVNTDRLIAKWNVDAYLEGNLETVDVSMLCHELGDSAIPEIVRLYEESKEVTVRGEAENYLVIYAERMEREREAGDRTFTLPHLLAKKALKKSGYLK